MADNIDEIVAAHTRVLKSISDSHARGAKISEAQTRDLLRTSRAMEQAFGSAEQSARSLSSVFKSTASGMVGFAGSLGRGNTAFTVVNTAIRGLSGSVGSLMKMIPIFGDGLAGFTDQMGRAAEFSVEQIEAGYGAFSQLSDIGLIGSKGIKGLAEDFAEAGIPLKTYSALLSNSSLKLAALSGTAHDVSGSFAETMGQLRAETIKGANGIDKQLRLLGYSTEDIGETFINYADIQRRLGREQSFSSKELQEGTASYAKELDLVAKLTGLSRKEQQKLVDQAMAESRWRATIQDMNPKQVIQMNALNNGLSAFSTELAQGMRDQASGFTQSEAAKALARTTGGESIRIQQRVNSGQITGIQALTEYQTAIDNNMIPMKALAKATGNQAGIFTDYAKNADFVNASFNELGKATKTQADQTKKPDQLTESAIKAVVTLEDTNTKIASMFMNSENAASALAKFAETTNLAAEAAYNLFLGGGGGAVNPARTATTSEVTKQQLMRNKANLLTEHRSLGHPGMLGGIIPNDETSRIQMERIRAEINKIDKDINSITAKIEEERITRVKSTTAMFNEFGLGEDYFKQFTGAAKHKDGWAGFQGTVQAKALGKGMNQSFVEPDIMEKAKKLISTSGRTGEALMAPTLENKELWKKVNEILSRFNEPKVDYDSTTPGVQDSIPEQVIKDQTDAFNAMNTKLDTIASNTDSLVRSYDAGNRIVAMQGTS